MRRAFRSEPSADGLSAHARSESTSLTRDDLPAPARKLTLYALAPGVPSVKSEEPFRTSPSTYRDELWETELSQLTRTVGVLPL
ncbi:hypothetical protein BD309DRAFT_864094 [Dichomitus squalens]|uniref:Uncharacterized protein n=2 Tax=Dichomitus squalens TaxID=114155 RepID=A0A4V2K488_9APHY|nr:hypothetical protein BD309DRAFT_864094 [Dichomitus squalens]TBU58604.1 hypothetical protein BD310DRAFT_878821 [Dichomitus squalens]